MSVEPYQFEPTKKHLDSDSSDGWEDNENNENQEQIDNVTGTTDRLTLSAQEWCQCSNCVPMSVNCECLCCVEIDDIRFNMLSPGNCIILSSYPL